MIVLISYTHLAVPLETLTCCCLQLPVESGWLSGGGSGQKNLDQIWQGNLLSTQFLHWGPTSMLVHFSSSGKSGVGAGLWSPHGYICRCSVLEVVGLTDDIKEATSLFMWDTHASPHPWMNPPPLLDILAPRRCIQNTNMQTKAQMPCSIAWCSAQIYIWTSTRPFPVFVCPLTCVPTLLRRCATGPLSGTQRQCLWLLDKLQRSFAAEVWTAQ